MQTMKEIFQEIEASGGMTPSRRLRDIANRFPDQIAFRDKRYGIWNEVTYGEFWEQVQYVSCALNHFGISKTDKVAIHSENRPEWLIADIGIQAIGGISVGLYPTNPPAEVKYLLSHSESKILFAEDQEQVDKALEIIEDIPNISKIVIKKEDINMNPEVMNQFKNNASGSKVNEFESTDNLPGLIRKSTKVG